MRGFLFISCCTAFLFSAAAKAEDVQTVQTFLSQDFTVVGIVQSPAGPGLFLQKKDKLFVCFVSETPGSTAVTTRYCKPVQ